MEEWIKYEQIKALFRRYCELKNESEYDEFVRGLIDILKL
jgi:hypothetical protein